MYFSKEVFLVEDRSVEASVALTSKCLSHFVFWFKQYCFVTVWFLGAF